MLFSSKITQRNNLSLSTYSSSFQNITVRSFDRVVPEESNTLGHFMWIIPKKTWPHYQALWKLNINLNLRLLFISYRPSFIFYRPMFIFLDLHLLREGKEKGRVKNWNEQPTPTRQKEKQNQISTTYTLTTNMTWAMS